MSNVTQISSLLKKCSLKELEKIDMLLWSEIHNRDPAYLAFEQESDMTGLESLDFDVDRRYNNEDD